MSIEEMIDIWLRLQKPGATGTLTNNNTLLKGRISPELLC